MIAIYYWLVHICWGLLVLVGGQKVITTPLKLLPNTAALLLSTIYFFGLGVYMRILHYDYILIPMDNSLRLGWQEYWRLWIFSGALFIVFLILVIKTKLMGRKE